MTSVKAGWAVHGKRPGAFDEYAVLAASSWPCPPAGFKKIIDLHLPGNSPGGKEGGTGGLPWVTFGAATAPEQVLCVIRQDWTGEADGASRPIVETTLVCVRLEDLTGGPLSLRALYDAAQDLFRSWQPPDGTSGDAVTIEVPDADIGHLAAVVDRVGLDRLATVAAAVIDKPVAVLSGDMPTLLDRIDLLDAVAALLPAGAKSWLRPATWTEPAMRNMLLRLAFTARRRDDQLRFPLSGQPDVSSNPHAGEYQAELVRLAQERGLETVIKHLAGLTALTARDPAQLLDGLLELDEGARLVRDVRSGAVDLDRIRGFDRNGGFTTLDDEQRRVVLEGFLGAASLGDLDVVAHHWSPALYRPLVTMAVRTVRRTAALLTDLLQFAGTVGIREKLLADLLEKGAPEAPDEVIRLVRRGHADPLVLRTVAEDVTLATRAVLEELKFDVDGVERLLNRLTGARHGAQPELLPAVRAVVLEEAGNATGQDVAKLERGAPGVTIGLLRTCRQRWPQRLPRIVAAAVDWLCYNLETGVAARDRPAWTELLRDARLDERNRGRADVLRLVLGDRTVLAGQPRHLPFAMVRGQGTELCEPALGFLEAARATGPRRQEMIIDLLAEDGTDVWSRDGDGGAMLDFLWELGDDKTDRRAWERKIARIVAHGVKRVRGLGSKDAFRRWLTVFNRYPNLLPELWGNRLTELPPNAPIPTLAMVCAQAVAAGTPVDHVLLQFERSWAAAELREFVYLLGFELHQLLGPGWLDPTRKFVRQLVRGHVYPHGHLNADRALRLNGEIEYLQRISELLYDELKAEVPKGLLREARRAGGRGGQRGGRGEAGQQAVEHWEQTQ